MHAAPDQRHKSRRLTAKAPLRCEVPCPRSAAVVSIEVGRKRGLFGGDRCRSITRVQPRADQSLQ
jgi:hypothetical protein